MRQFCLAVISIWFGAGRSIPLLDFPAWIWPVFAFAYILITVWVIPMFHARRNALFYVSEMYLIGAAVWFPWIFVTANLMINRFRSRNRRGDGRLVNFQSHLFLDGSGSACCGVLHHSQDFRPRHLQLPPGAIELLASCDSRGVDRFFPLHGRAISGMDVGGRQCSRYFILLAVVATVANLMLTLKGCSKLWEYSPSLRFTVMGSPARDLYDPLGDELHFPIREEPSVHPLYRGA